MIDDVLNHNVINIIQYTRQYCVRNKEKIKMKKYAGTKKGKYS